MAGEIFTVSSADELQDTLRNATGGDIIELAAGQYGEVALSRLNFTSEVVIRSEDLNNPATFNSVNVASSTNLTFEGLLFDFIPDADTLEHHSALRFYESSDVAVRNSTFTGDVAVAGIPSDSEPGTQSGEGILGELIGRAITLYHTSNVVIENNNISRFTKGVVYDGGHDITVTQNEIHDLRMSPVTGTLDYGLTVEENYFHDFNPWNFGGLGDHGDYVHVWTTPDQIEPISGVIIRNNLFVQGEGQALLGIYLDDNDNELGYTNAIVDGNVIHLGDSQAIRFEDVNGAVISNNSLIQSSGGVSDAPGIGLHDSSNITVTDNIMAAPITGNSMIDQGNSKVTTSGNLLVQNTDPQGESYVGTVFVQSSQDGKPLANLSIIPGSMAEGLGSPLSQPDKQPADLQPSFQIFSAEGQENSLVFDAANTFGSSGEVLPEDARFIWDLGDGTKVEGISGQHTYATAGEYEVTLTVIMNGTETTATASAAVQIAGRDVLTYDVQSGTFKQQGYATETTLEHSDQKSVAYEGKMAIDLGGDGAGLSIARENLGNFFGSESFELSMTLKADQPGLSWGEVARVHSSFVISVQSDGELDVLLQTENGDRVSLVSTGVVVNDGEDHDIIVHLDGDFDTAVLMVDGKVVASSAVLDSMPNMGNWGLVFGNPWGKQNFDGKITALDLDAVSTDYTNYSGSVAEFTAIEGNGGSGTEPSVPLPDPVEPVDPVEPIETETGEGTEAAPSEEIFLPTLDDFVFNMGPLNSDQLQGGSKVVSQNNDDYLLLSGDKDHVRLGRLTEFEDSDQLSFSVDFVKANADDTDMRLVWNHTYVGLAVEDDGLRVYLGQADQAFHKSILIDDLGLNDTDQHQARLVVDDVTDHLQVFLDGELVHEEYGDRDFELNDSMGSDGRQWGWTLGSAWSHDFQGEIHDFRVDSTANFLPTLDDGFLIA